MPFVRDIMTREVVSIDPDRTVLDAAKRMAEHRVGGLVVARFGRPVGLLTERDILMKVTAVERSPKRLRVGTVMSSPVVTVSPRAPLRAAARLMLDKETRWLVVTRRDKVEGILTASDLTEGFLESYARAIRRGAPVR